VLGHLPVPDGALKLPLLGRRDRAVLGETLRGLHPALDPLGELDLLGGVEQGIAADLAQVRAECVEVPDARRLFGAGWPGRCLILDLYVLGDLGEKLRVFDLGIVVLGLCGLGVRVLFLSSLGHHTSIRAIRSFRSRSSGAVETILSILGLGRTPGRSFDDFVAFPATRS
jgi:hypothetical protein